MNGTYKFCPPFTPMVKILSEVESDHYKIEHFHVSPEEASFARMRGQYMLEEGDYVSLRRKTGFRSVIMSDTPFERYTNLSAAKLAKGDVLIGGLGIGMTLVPIMSKPEVSSITVVEISGEVVEMVWPQISRRLGAHKVELVIGDMFEWFPEGKKFDTVWFDVWDAICSDNLKDMAKLHRRWSKRLNKGGWMESWAQDLCRRLR